MVKLALSAIVFASTAVVSWTGYRSATTPAPEAAQTAAVDPLTTEAAYRHRNMQPNHWRGYVLQQRRF